MLAQIVSEKSLLVIVTLVGMAFCTVGISQVAARGEWLNPMAIVSYLIGALILLIVGATLFELRLPWIDSPRAALIAVVLLTGVKVALTQLHRVLA